MAHLQRIKPEPKPDYRVLFEIDPTWAWKDFVLAVRPAFRGPLGLVEFVAGFARLVWSKALDVLVDFLYAVAWHAHVLGQGVLCILWLLWKGVTYPVAYLLLLMIGIMAHNGKDPERLVEAMTDGVLNETPRSWARAPGKSNSQSTPVNHESTPSPYTFKEYPAPRVVLALSARPLSFPITCRNPHLLQLLSLTILSDPPPVLTQEFRNQRSPVERHRSLGCKGGPMRNGVVDSANYAVYKETRNA